MPFLDLPYVSEMRGGTAERRDLRDAVKTLRQAMRLLTGSPPMPFGDKIIGIVHRQGLLVSLNEEQEHLKAEIAVEGFRDIVLRSPLLAGTDLVDVASRLCRITITAIETSLKRTPEAWLDRFLLRNDAICAIAAQTARVSHHEIKLRPATPFSRPRITITDLNTANTVQWSLGPEHDAWIAALHISYTAYDIPNGSIHIIFDTLIQHDGASDVDPLRMMRMLSDLPPAPPLVIPDEWEKMF